MSSHHLIAAGHCFAPVWALHAKQQLCEGRACLPGHCDQSLGLHFSPLVGDLLFPIAPCDTHSPASSRSCNPCRFPLFLSGHIPFPFFPT